MEKFETCRMLENEISECITVYAEHFPLEKSVNVINETQIQYENWRFCEMRKFST